MIKHIVRSAFKALSVYFNMLGVLWTFLEIHNWLVGEEVIKPFAGVGMLWGSVLLIVLAFLVFCMLPMYKTHIISEKDVQIRIRIGNILHGSKCTILVGTNDELSHDLSRIGNGSLQAQIQSNERNYRNLSQAITQELEAKPAGARLPYGRVVKVGGTRKRSFHLLVMSSLDPAGEAWVTPVDLRTALHSYFRELDHLSFESGRLRIPIIGTGNANIKLSKEMVIKMMVHLFVAEVSNAERTPVKQLTIYVRPADLMYVDLIDINQYIGSVIYYFAETGR